MKDTTGSKIVFSLAILILFLSLCTAFAQAGNGDRANRGRTSGIMLLARLPALLPYARKTESGYAERDYRNQSHLPSRLRGTRRSGGKPTNWKLSLFLPLEKSSREAKVGSVLLRNLRRDAEAEIELEEPTMIRERIGEVLAA